MRLLWCLVPLALAACAARRPSTSGQEPRWGGTVLARTQLENTACPASVPTAQLDSTVYPRDSVDVQPRISHSELPPFRSDSGRVVLAVVVNADGRPDMGSLHVVSSSDSSMVHIALRILSGATYCPGMIGDHAVRVRTYFEMHYHQGH